jgi:hypothetical protein
MTQGAAPFFWELTQMTILLSPLEPALEPGFRIQRFELGTKAIQSQRLANCDHNSLP